MSSKKVIDYYNQCHTDYRIFWNIHKNYSIHFGFYDKAHKKHDDAVINMNRILAKISKITSKDKILDAGCGIGGSSIWLAKNFGTNVIGINIHKMQVEIAKKLARKNGVDNLVKFFVKDFMDTNFSPNSFDVVWGLESICHGENKKVFLTKAKRVLKNNGRIIIADFFLKKENLTNNEKRDMNKWLYGWALPNLSSVTEFQKYLEELGFKNIEFRDITKNVMPSSRYMYLLAIIGYPVYKFLEYFNIRTKMQIENIISAYYQHKTLKKDLWTYGIFYAEK